MGISRDLESRRFQGDFLASAARVQNVHHAAPSKKSVTYNAFEIQVLRRALSCASLFEMFLAREVSQSEGA
jgi:hypothetical protein